MMRNKWMAAAALLATTTGALGDTYEFDSITNLSHSGSGFTGVLVNDTVPTTLTLSSTNAQCFSWLQLMMTDRGVFTLTVDVTVTTGGPLPPGAFLNSCRLNVKP
jgi:hypothetical protein